jgi:hypothetical protein
MHADFQVVVEGTPEASKFSKDLLASFFVLPKKIKYELQRLQTSLRGQVPRMSCVLRAGSTSNKTHPNNTVFQGAKVFT